MIQAVLFEFDGVIAETREARRMALLDALEEDGLALSDDEYDERCAALPVRSAIRAAFSWRDITGDETRVDLAAVRAERAFARSADAGLSLMVGARGLIESLQGHTRLAIVSRAARRDIDATLSLAQLDQPEVADIILQLLDREALAQFEYYDRESDPQNPQFRKLNEQEQQRILINTMLGVRNFNVPEVREKLKYLAYNDPSPRVREAGIEIISATKTDVEIVP